MKCECLLALCALCALCVCFVCELRVSFACTLCSLCVCFVYALCVRVLRVCFVCMCACVCVCVWLGYLLGTVLEAALAGLAVLPVALGDQLVGDLVRFAVRAGVFQQHLRLVTAQVGRDGVQQLLGACSLEV